MQWSQSILITFELLFLHLVLVLVAQVEIKRGMVVISWWVLRLAHFLFFGVWLRLGCLMGGINIQSIGLLLRGGSGRGNFMLFLMFERFFFSFFLVLLELVDALLLIELCQFGCLLLHAALGHFLLDLALDCSVSANHLYLLGCRRRCSKIYALSSCLRFQLLLDGLKSRHQMSFSFLLLFLLLSFRWLADLIYSWESMPLRLFFLCWLLSLRRLNGLFGSGQCVLFALFLLFQLLQFGGLDDFFRFLCEGGWLGWLGGIRLRCLLDGLCFFEIEGGCSRSGGLFLGRMDRLINRWFLLRLLLFCLRVGIGGSQLDWVGGRWVWIGCHAVPHGDLVLHAHLIQYPRASYG